MIQLRCALLIITLFSTIVFCEVTRRTVAIFPDSKVQEMAFYKDGKEVARQQLDREGNVIQTEGKIPDGVINEYYPSGKLMAAWNYRNGKLEGISKLYYESGKLMAIWNYKNDALEGVARQFFENGEAMTEWNYKKGQLDGMSVVYNEDGSVKQMLNFKEGTRVQ